MNLKVFSSNACLNGLLGQVAEPEIIHTPTEQILVTPPSHILHCNACCGKDVCETFVFFRVYSFTWLVNGS
jgi:hypothetical protein